MSPLHGSSREVACLFLGPSEGCSPPVLRVSVDIGPVDSISGVHPFLRVLLHPTADGDFRDKDLP